MSCPGFEFFFSKNPVVLLCKKKKKVKNTEEGTNLFAVQYVVL